MFDQLRRPDQVVFHGTGAAVDGLDGDKVDLAENINRQLIGKIKNAGETPLILRVNEDSEKNGYHPHFVGLIPVDRIPHLLAIGRQERVSRFDKVDATGKVTAAAFKLSIAAQGDLAARIEASYPSVRVDRSGIAGLAGYLCKAACTSAPLGIGGSRVRPNGNLAAQMTAWVGFQPRPRENPRRGLHRSPKPQPTPATVVYRDNLFEALPVHVRTADTVSAPRRRRKLEALPQLPLKLAPTALDMLADLGPTDHARAALIGRSRAQVTNMRNRQFGTGRDVVRSIITAFREIDGEPKRLAA